MKIRNLSKRLFSVFVLLMLSSTTIRAALKDDILAFTGSRTKMVWLKVANSPPINNYNTEQPVKLASFDTQVGTEVLLDGGTSEYRAYPFITRSGQYVIWNNVVSGTSYIQKMDGSSPKQVLLSGVPFYYAVSCHYDAASKKEYIYFCNKAEAKAASDRVYMEGTKLYKMELVNGAVNANNKVLVHDLTTPYWEGATRINETNRGRVFRAMPGVVSGDGRFFSVNEPWPDIMVVDMIADTGRRVSTSGCWPNIAPDNSRRLFYFNDAHTILYMLTTFTSTQRTNITVADPSKLPGLLKGGSGTDLCAPRWSNHPRFISVGNPLTQVDTVKKANFYIVKFNEAFTGVEAGLNVTASFGDCNKVGDLWIASGEGPGTTDVSRSFRTSATRAPAFTVSGNRAILLTSRSPEPFQASLVTSTGRLLATKTVPAHSSIEVSSGNVHPGTYFLMITTHTGETHTRMVTCR